MLFAILLLAVPMSSFVNNDLNYRVAVALVATAVAVVFAVIVNLQRSQNFVLGDAISMAVGMIIYSFWIQLSVWLLTITQELGMLAAISMFGAILSAGCAIAGAMLALTAIR